MTASATPTPTRLVAYIRVSTADQAESGYSLDAQRHRLEAYAEAMDIQLVAIEVDAGVSAKSIRRPGLQGALARLQAGEADGLLVAKLDRLTRSVGDLSALLAPELFGERYSLLSVADSIDTRTAAGRLVLNVLTSVSQWEREAISERTREGLAEARRQGVEAGAAPYGYRHVGGRREPVAVQQTAVARMVELRSGGATLRTIAATLQTEGHRPARGDTWQASTVGKILKRAA